MSRGSEVRENPDGVTGAQQRHHLVGLAVSVLAAAVWIVLAWRTPGSTHHFAPLVAGSAWSYALRQGQGQLVRNDRVLAVVGGVSVALAAFVVLVLADKLQGPPLLTAVPVRAELPIMAVLGGLVGNRLLRRPAATAVDRPSP